MNGKGEPEIYFMSIKTIWRKRLHLIRGLWEFMKQILRHLYRNRNCFSMRQTYKNKGWVVMATVTVTLLRLRLNNRKNIECRKIDPSNKITDREGRKWNIVSPLRRKNAKFNSHQRNWCFYVSTLFGTQFSWRNVFKCFVLIRQARAKVKCIKSLRNLLVLFATLFIYILSLKSVCC